MAYSLARFNTGGQHLSFWVLSQRFLPPIAIVLPIFLIYRSLGLHDTRFGLILAYTVFTLPVSVWMMFAYFRQHAALARGGGAGRRLQPLAARSGGVAVPLAAPGIVAAAVFAFIACWTEFFFALVLTSRNAFTLPTVFRAFLGFQGAQYGEASALAIVSLVPSIVLGMLVQTPSGARADAGRGAGLGNMFDMADVKITGLHKHFGAVHAVRGVDLDNRRWRVHRAGRPLRLRQEHAAADHRRARGGHRRHDRNRRRGRQ